MQIGELKGPVGDPDLDRRWDPSLSRGPIKLVEVSDHSACCRVVRRARLMSSNGRELDGIWIEGQSMDTIEKRNKAAERTKKRRPEDRLSHWTSRRMALEKIKSAIERSSRRVTEQFRDAVPYRPKLQNFKDAEGKRKTAIQMTKGWIADWIGDPD
uniref:Uncharacterized protein n=1 Tax=Solanum tuberosum TaxID=4113 RepID=M1DJQ7_SOLTU